MDVNMNAAVTFGELLQANPKAAEFYDRCTPEQRQAILLQMEKLTRKSQLQAFVDNLPSMSL